VAAVLRRWSPEDAAPPRRLRVLAGPGLAVYGLTMTFAAIDWVMSLEPHWFSTVYGMMFATGQVLAGFAFVIAVTTLLARRAHRLPLRGTIRPPPLPHREASRAPLRGRGHPLHALRRSLLARRAGPRAARAVVPLDGPGSARRTRRRLARDLRLAARSPTAPSTPRPTAPRGTRTWTRLS